MYLKVLVMEVKENYCLAMTQDGEILRIKRKKNMKIGDRIFVLQEDLYEEESEEKMIPYKAKRNRKVLWSGAAVAAAAAVLVGAAVYEHGLLHTSYALVSVDGAMSVQLELNKKGTVKKAVSYDHTLTEAELKSLEGKDFQETAKFLNLTTEDGKEKWLISYAFYQEETLKDAGFQKKLEAIFKEEAALCLKGDREDIEKAEEENKTLGIYLAEKEEERREEEKREEQREKEEEKKEEQREKEEEKREEQREKELEKKKEQREKKEELQEKEDVEEEDEEDRKQAASVSQSKPVTRPDPKPQPQPVPQVSEPQDEDWEPEESYEEEYEEEGEESETEDE